MEIVPFGLSMISDSPQRRTIAPSEATIMFLAAWQVSVSPDVVLTSSLLTMEIVSCAEMEMPSLLPVVVSLALCIAVSTPEFMTKDPGRMHTIVSLSRRIASNG